MRISKIYFDMDGVLADFTGGIRTVCGLEPVEQGADKEADDRQWEAIKNVGHFYDMLEPMPGAVAMYKALSEKYDCEILSAIPKAKRGIVNAADDKRNWAHRLLSDTMKVNIVYREDKKNYATGKDCILIDDLPENIAAWESFGGTGICFTTAEDVLKQIKVLEDV